MAPALVLGAQLLFGALFGLMGLALADPIVAMIKTALEQKSVEDEAEAVAEAKPKRAAGRLKRRRPACRRAFLPGLDEEASTGSAGRESDTAAVAMPRPGPGPGCLRRSGAGRRGRASRRCGAFRRAALLLHHLLHLLHLPHAPRRVGRRSEASRCRTPKCRRRRTARPAGSGPGRSRDWAGSRAGSGRRPAVSCRPSSKPAISPTGGVTIGWPRAALLSNVRPSASRPLIMEDEDVGRPSPAAPRRP